MLGEVLTPERLSLDHSGSLFLTELYRRAEKDFTQRERLLVLENEDAPSWFEYKDARSQKRYANAHIINATLSSWKDFVLGFALVSGQRDSISIPTHSFQFGIRKKTQELEGMNGIDLLENVVHRKLPRHGTVGDIHINGNGNLGNLEVDCFMDRWAYGGKEINRWPQEKIISEDGVFECLNIVKRVTEAVWI